MGIVKRQSARGAVLMYLGIGIGYVNVAFLFPKYLSPEEIGVRSLLVDSSLLLSQFFMLGFGRSIVNFFPRFKTEDKTHHGFVSLFFGLPVLFFGAFALIFYLISGWYKGLYSEVPLFVELFWLLLPLIFFQGYIALFQSLFSSLFQTVITNFAKEVLLRVLSTAFILLYGLGMISLTQYFYLNVASFGVLVVLFAVVLARQGQLRFSAPGSFVTRELRREIMFYSGFNVLTTAAGYLVMKVDLIMIGSLLDGKNAGIYSIATFIAIVVEVTHRAVNQIISPVFSELWAKNDEAKIQEIYGRSSSIQVIVGTLIFLLIWLSLDDLFHLIPNGEVYAAGKYVVLFLGLSRLVKLAFANAGAIISFSKNYKFNFVTLILLSLISVGLNYVLIRAYGLVGAAIATLISLLVFHLLRVVYCQVVWRFHPFTWDHLKLVVIAGLVLFAVGWLNFPFSPLLSIVLRSILIIVLFSLGTLGLRMAPELQKYVRDILKKFTSNQG